MSARAPESSVLVQSQLLKRKGILDPETMKMVEYLTYNTPPDVGFTFFNLVLILKKTVKSKKRAKQMLLAKESETQNVNPDIQGYEMYTWHQKSLIHPLPKLLSTSNKVVLTKDWQVNGLFYVSSLQIPPCLFF